MPQTRGRGMPRPYRATKTQRPLPRPYRAPIQNVRVERAHHNFYLLSIIFYLKTAGYYDIVSYYLAVICVRFLG